jgi:ABC-type transport system involved in cytochrome bd biosynthesis fused ATPase/permease subunit
MNIVKRRYFFLPTPIVAAVVIIVGWLLFAAPVIAKYNIHEAMASEGVITTTNNTITLSNLIYSEVDKTTSQKLVGVNGTTARATEVTFLGHGMAKDVNYTDSGKALVTIRDNGKVINTKGHVAIMTSSGSGKASADFQEIGRAFESNNKGITITATGTAFFDANATGKLAFLNNAVAIYKDIIYNNGTDKVIAWEWK